LDDHYEGVEGARRLIEDLDEFLQGLMDNTESIEMLRCLCDLRVAGGERLSLRKTYRSENNRPPAKGQQAVTTPSAEAK
jgi:hypothetical protein